MNDWSADVSLMDCVQRSVVHALNTAPASG